MLNTPDIYNCCLCYTANWKEKLLEDIDADQLPVNWGGTARGWDGNPYCTPAPGEPYEARGVSRPTP